ncbi:MAG: type II toxin-antitoxin system Phd/YefM family antitoxin [Patescibacteria group bacterium]|nr:type II toxin-antitoxin system Phd/YefM family antitoxin [Patescibacteria group bacterium]
MQNIISITQARNDIFKIADKVQKGNTYYTLTEHGRAKAVIMSAEEFDSWVETMEVMRDIPDLKKDIEEVERDLKSGAYKKYTTLEEILAKEGFVKN